ncbi:MAG: TRAP transporter substrate-binding protein, partial [Bacteroidota bacterium]
KLPAAQFFASIPFGMNAQQTNAWMISGGGLELWREIYAQYNLVPMLGGNTGVQMGGWFNKEINSIDDFAGLKMRIPGLGGKVLQKAGGTAVLSPGSELYTNLERGIIDATEWIGPYHDYSMGFHEIAKYYYAPGWHEAGTALEFIFNKKKYDALPNDLKSILQSAAARANMHMLSVAEAKNAEYMEIIRNKTKVEVRQFTPDTLRALRRFNNEVLEEFVASDPLAKRVYSSFKTFQDRAAKWSELTEKIYYNDIQPRELG